jgi:hypothetical protein
VVVRRGRDAAALEVTKSFSGLRFLAIAIIGSVYSKPPSILTDNA